ncbi:hypothetical protein OH809_38290 [Streptomyces sp. NBC_00873]|nr:hypothetical protein OH809_38290 [Streptomyces sp. NBC_00873]WTA42122.1 hypothetical protein OH821_05420 [Streptomyces sp. NBC_00842]
MREIAVGLALVGFAAEVDNSAAGGVSVELGEFFLRSGNAHL